MNQEIIYNAENRGMNVVYFAVKIAGRVISTPRSTLQEAQGDMANYVTKEREQAVEASIVKVTADGKELLFE